MNENKWCGSRPEKCIQRQITVVKRTLAVDLLHWHSSYCETMAEKSN